MHRLKQFSYGLPWPADARLPLHSANAFKHDFYEAHPANKTYRANEYRLANNSKSSSATARTLTATQPQGIPPHTKMTV